MTKKIFICKRVCRVLFCFVLFCFVLLFIGFCAIALVSDSLFKTGKDKIFNVKDNI